MKSQRKAYGGLSRRERFMSHVHMIPESGCWIYDGGTVGDGYAASAWGRAHRVAYEEFISPIPTGMVIAHKCDVPCCVNPSHLFACTQAQNIADKIAKGREARGERCGSSKLSDSQAAEIKHALKAGYTHGIYTRLAAKYGVHRAIIARMHSGRLWAHVD